MSACETDRNEQVSRVYVYSFMPSLDALIGIPMEVLLGPETAWDLSLVCASSYSGHERIMEIFVATGRNSYQLDVFRNSRTTSGGTQTASFEKGVHMSVTRNFIQAIRQGHALAISGEVILPAMRVL